MNSENNAVIKRTLDLFSLLTGKTFTAVEVRHLNHLYRMVVETENVSVATEALRTGSTAPVVESILSHGLLDAIRHCPEHSALTDATREAIATGRSAILVDPDATPAVTLLENVYKEPELTPKPEPVPEETRPTAIKSADTRWMPGYNYKIMVTYRDRSRYDEAYTVHYVERPSQEEFDSHFKLFLTGEAYVHIKQADGRSKSWNITHEYSKHIDADGHIIKEKVVETFDADENWPNDKQWRIKFFDVRIGKLNYVYFAYQPSGMTLAKYHKGKVFAVAEQRPS